MVEKKFFEKNEILGLISKFHVSDEQKIYKIQIKNKNFLFSLNSIIMEVILNFEQKIFSYFLMDRWLLWTEKS